MSYTIELSDGSNVIQTINSGVSFDQNQIIQFSDLASGKDNRIDITVTYKIGDKEYSNGLFDYPVTTDSTTN